MCVICQKETDEPLITISQKGADTLNWAITERKDSLAVITSGQSVHPSCRKSYTNKETIERLKKKIARCEPAPDVRRTRSGTGTSCFDFKKSCLFCGLLVDESKSHRKGFEFSHVLTLEFDNSLRDVCKKRNDFWASQVLLRIATISDLHAEDAIYHQKCYQYFRLLKSVPSAFASPLSESGAVVGEETQKNDPIRITAFLAAMSYLDERPKNQEQITVEDLQRVMEEQGVEAYTTKHMKSKIVEHYKGNVIIIKINPNQRVITFCRSVESILLDFYRKNDTAGGKHKLSNDEQKESILDAAANLLLTDILSSPPNKTLDYSFFSSISSEKEALKVLPISLRTILEKILTGKKKLIKVASIGQAIMQAARPKAITAPLQIALGIQLHHILPSRFLIDHLHCLGFCCSYKEVGLFIRNASVYGSCNLQELRQSLTESPFIQFVADNADHNFCTLDGKDTFHGAFI